MNRAKGKARKNDETWDFLLPYIASIRVVSDHVPITGIYALTDDEFDQFVRIKEFANAGDRVTSGELAKVLVKSITDGHPRVYENGQVVKITVDS